MPGETEQKSLFALHELVLYKYKIILLHELFFLWNLKVALNLYVYNTVNDK